MYFLFYFLRHYFLRCTYTHIHLFSFYSIFKYYAILSLFYFIIFAYAVICLIIRLLYLCTIIVTILFNTNNNNYYYCIIILLIIVYLGYYYVMFILRYILVWCYVYFIADPICPQPRLSYTLWWLRRNVFIIYCFITIIIQIWIHIIIFIIHYITLWWITYNYYMFA